MAHTPIYEWEGHEYRFEEKSADWYWALGIIGTATIIASVLFGNVLLALVIASACTSIALTAAKKTRVHRFAILEGGVAIDETFYPFSHMLHYSVLEYADTSLPPSLSIKTKQFLSPHLLIPIVNHDPVEIYNYIANHLPEGRHDESVIDRLADLFKL